MFEMFLDLFSALIVVVNGPMGFGLYKQVPFWGEVTSPSSLVYIEGWLFWGVHKKAPGFGSFHKTCFTQSMG